MIRKGIALIVMLLFIGLSIAPSTGFNVIEQTTMIISNGKTLYVGGSGPGNYTKIQDAIDDASEGDTVFVYDDSSPYSEWVTVDTTINLIGEDRNTTVIDTYTDNCTVNIYADKVNISGFTIRNNDKWSGCPGIYIKNSNYNTIEDNNMDLNMPTAIYIDNSNNNTITNNYISDCDKGISLYKSSNNNIITNNYFINAGIAVENSYQNIVLNNTVNDKPIVYFEDVENSTINVNAGQIILIDCDNITIKNKELCNTAYGIELWRTDNCQIIDNNISNNWNGIYQHSSNNNTITNNTICSNKNDGIEIQSSNNNTINRNILNSNIGSGIYSFGFLDDTIITNNNISSNKKRGISLRRSCIRNTITGNTINSNGWNGIELLYSSNSNIVTCNVINSNSVGLLLHWSDENTITDNSISKDSIYLTGSNKNNIGGNNISNGGILFSGDNNIISNNSIFKGGLYFRFGYQGSKQIIIFNNTVNGKPLVYLENESNIVIDVAGEIILRKCDNITIQNQDLSYTSVGINLQNTNNCIISNNTIISDGIESIKFEDSDKNIIIDNSIQKSEVGIDLRYSDNNTIINNEISSHNNEGIDLFKSKSTNITGNEITSNNDFGIDVFRSDNTIICNNIISNSWRGLLIEHSAKNKIMYNNISSNYIGLLLEGSNNNNIYENNISSNSACGIDLDYANNNNISDNIIVSNSDNGIRIRGNTNTITSNTISSNTENGIYILNSKFNEVMGNNITSNKNDGIHLARSENNTIKGNNILGNNIGIYLHHIGDDNIFYHNNFINNVRNAYDKSSNTWDNGYPSGGNFWEDYTGNDSDGDGIGDIPYPIPGGDNEDRYPLMEPWGKYCIPIAKFTWTPSHPYPKETIHFNASESFDYDGYITLYEWDWDDDGIFDENHMSPTASHSWSNGGSYPVNLRVTDNTSRKGRITKTITVNSPPNIPTIDGPTSGKKGIKYNYTFNATDPDNDNIKFFVEWGDGDIVGTDYNPSGKAITLKHSWWKKGVYIIRCKSIDIYGNESDWATLEVTMPKNQNMYLVWLEMFPLLQRLLDVLKNIKI